MRVNAERDWQDAALLLSLIGDPVAAAAECDKKDRVRLRRLEPLLDGGHVGWEGIEDLFDYGSVALDFLIADPS